MTSTRLRAMAGLALAATLLLSGCSNGVPAFNPGLAARVGDQVITLSRVDDVATSYCAAAEKQLQQGQVIPQHYLRGQVAGALALRTAAEQFAAAHDVTPDATYDQAVAQAKEQDALKALPADQVDALIEVQGASVFVGAVELSAGRAILSDRGKTNPSDKAAAAAGQKAFRDWLADNEVRIDPRFGISIESGQTTKTDTSVSYPLGDVASKADADQPDAAYAAGLPAAQRCG